MGLTAKRLKYCKVCGGEFKPSLSTQKVCGPQCASSLAKEKTLKEFNRETGRRKRALLDTDSRHWMKNAQREFNRFIRFRDAKDPCISCGRVEVEYTIGGSWDCGHYRSVGAMPQLRFEELNAHKQCKSCNGGSSKYAKKGETVSTEYRLRLVEKIGAEKVAWLEGPHPEKRYRVEDLKEICRVYKVKNAKFCQ